MYLEKLKYLIIWNRESMYIGFVFAWMFFSLGNASMHIVCGYIRRNPCRS